MKQDIIVVGAGGVEAAKIALHTGHDNITVITPEEVKQMSYTQPEPFILTNPHPVGGYFIGEKQFICKGKHEYRELKTECGDIYWICQCGRKL